MVSTGELDVLPPQKFKVDSHYLLQAIMIIYEASIWHKSICHSLESITPVSKTEESTLQQG